ncbi:NHL repeat-containing protein [Candidatus Odyssella thessalonicensis]|uniref:NHL repeat-containing protein n=1 Tax=Candidatus Odyssella thessalonicensis TaxID=84647 RepID=UPI000225BEC7|nr:NHL repeat-containing protein [Candidatus Odyssella thessalonicensis]
MSTVSRSQIFLSLISGLLITTHAYSNPTVGVWNIVSTLAGSTGGYAEGTGASARFNYPYGIAVHSSGTIYVADSANHRIRSISSAGTTSVFAGSGTAGTTEGTGASAQFNNPYGVAVDSSGTLYVSEYTNHRIRKITSAGVTSLLAGSAQGYAEGTGSGARFDRPYSVAVDSSGTVYVADFFNSRIRRITSAGVTSTLAGSSTGGYLEGTGGAAQFGTPIDVAVDSSGTVYVTDTYTQRVRKITSGGVTSLLAGSNTIGYAEGTGASARFSSPYGIAVDSSGTAYVADSDNHRIRKITSGGTTSLIAGTGIAGTAGGSGAGAQFNYPAGIDVDSSGSLYIADSSNHLIRKIDALQIYINTDTYSSNCF